MLMLVDAHVLYAVKVGNDDLFILFYFICHIYPPFTRKQIVSLYFGRDVRTRLEVAISEMSGPPVFHIKVVASR